MFEDFYGLTGKPFQLTPDPQFYFHSLTHRKALSYLGYGLAQGEGFIVITGEVGAGKSTLVEHLVSTIDPGQLTIGQIVTSKLDEEEIVHVVAQSFGLEIEGHDKATALGMIETFLHEEARAGRRCLLIVDESQNLTVAALEELRMFSNFQLGSHPLLQTLLLGQPEFRATLQGSERLEQLRQRVIATHHLEAMLPDEIQPYIEHRLGLVGWRGHPSFDQQIFAEIYEASGGIPRRINVLANRLMLLGAVEQRERFDQVMFKTVVADMARDSEVPESALRAQAIANSMREDATPSAEGEQAAARSAGAVDLTAVTALLAERDSLIAELQQAVADLSKVRETVAVQDIPAFADIAAKLESLEARVADQESAIRHTLSMLIEWIESDGLKPIAA